VLDRPLVWSSDLIETLEYHVPEAGHRHAQVTPQRNRRFPAALFSPTTAGSFAHIAFSPSTTPRAIRSR
jgi:hypothetical protein